jgi:hypothetical protein
LDRQVARSKEAKTVKSKRLTVHAQEGTVLEDKAHVEKRDLDCGNIVLGFIDAGVLLK